MAEISLPTALKSISDKTALVRKIKTTLVDAFGEDGLRELRGNVQLVQEILITIESMRHPVPEADRDTLFHSVYGTVFGAPTDIERKMLDGIVSHLRSTGMIYRRTKIGNWIRAILRMFRA